MSLVKNALISPSVHSLPISTDHMTLDADAYDVQIVCLLLQQQRDGPTKPIEYWFWSLTSAERK